MSEFEYYNDGHDVNYVNQQQQASNYHHHQQQQHYQSSSYRSSNDYSSSPSSSESLLDDGYVLFQSVQISIPILPFLIMMGFVLFVIGIRVIKYFQLSVNWHVITKSFKHQIILLSLFFQIPLLCFYLYSLIKFGKSDASLVLIIMMNSILGGMASFINEKSLGYFVIMLSCFITSLLVEEAHVKTILICLCFLVVTLKIQKIIFQRSKQFESEDFTDIVGQDNLFKDPSHNFGHIHNNTDRYKEGGSNNDRFYSGHRFQPEHREPYNHLTKSFPFQNKRSTFEYNHQPPQPTMNNADMREVHNDLHDREDIYIPKTSNWNWLGSMFSNMRWFNNKKQDDVLDRRNVKLQVPERQKVTFDKAIVVNNTKTQRMNTVVEEREEPFSSSNSYAQLYPSISSNIPPSPVETEDRPHGVKSEDSPRGGISPFLLNHSLSLTQSNSMKQQERPRTLQTKENLKVPTEPEKTEPRYFEKQQVHIAKRVQQVPPQPQSAFKPREISGTSKQRPPIVHSVVEEEEEFIPTASTFDNDEDEE